ncbi:photosystem I reaction centre subunit III [Rubidibacter lacunae KORDI 51-2]|uniref:Photosystem I reaction center subunit III n=1 Tax=Rubidibacter lacunae KORDI 51-2 TaxID=582515 RepID=U5DK29_9CHRO|nr:photosystem I reaction centre subunit III [Rubidibacter lacunae]ERN40934.1 photosystem I reaction centre subunit III [Rubidibacter lacunae KORDI 51-2]
MARIIPLILAVVLWLGFAPSASAQVDNPNNSVLVPCSESSAFQARAANARNTTGDPLSGQKRFERYSNLLCGPEGLPHLVVDGSLSHAGEFITPSLLFLYIAGFIGWAGRSYLISIRTGKKPEEKEVVIDVPLAIKCVSAALLWPLAAVKELLSGELTVPEADIPVSPR